MKKRDLRNGMIVELENGGRYIVIKDFHTCNKSMDENILLSLNDSYMPFSEYDENLKCSDGFTIMKVGYLRYPNLNADIDWIWQRQEITEDEKVILKYIDKEYKWIAREFDNSIAIYKSKPFKGYDEIAQDDTWLTKDNSYNWLGLTHDLFPFIKKEDEEPYNIEELLNEN